MGEKEVHSSFDLDKYNAKILLTYSTEHLAKKDKIRFYYALKGRDGKSGVVQVYDIVHLGRTVLLVPKKFDQDVQDFLKQWNCKFGRREVLIKDEDKK